MAPSALALSLSLTRAAAPTGASSQRRPRFAALYLDPCAAPGDDWLAACYRVAAVEPISAHSALLGLGICSEAEAYGVLRDLLHRLAALGVTAHAGIGPSLVLSQLAGLRVPTHAPLMLVTPDDASAFLHAIPVTLLARLHLQGALTPETVERLQRYGLRTLGHVARMGEPALRRQFGAAGALLAAIAHGRDIRPLCPVPAPAREHVRLRLAYPVAPERALALLPHLAAQAAAHLHERRCATRELRLRVRWERGGVSLARHTLRAYTHDPARLAEEACHLLTTLLDEHATAAAAAAVAELIYNAVAELRLTLGDFAPLVPTQAAFWRVRAQRLAAAHAAADTLTRRHGRPLLLYSHLAVPDAIFAEDRYRLAPPGDSELAHSAPASARAHTRRSGAPSAPPADAWREVPLARHWW